MFKKATGKSNNDLPFEAGKEAAKAALESAEIKDCDLVIVHATDGFSSYEELLKGVREETKEAPLIGTLAGGVITQEGPDEKLKTVVVMVLKADEIKFTPVISKNVEDGSDQMGKEIAEQLSNNWPDDAKLMMVFPGGFSINPNELFSGIENNIPEKIPFYGGSSGGTLEFKKTYQFFNDEVLTDSVICVLLSGNFEFEGGISHGAVPLSISSFITKADKNVIYEFDNNPAFEIYSGFAETHQDILQRTSVCLGSKISETADSELYEQTVLRIPLAIQEDGSLVMAAEWPQGEEIFICKRDFEVMKKSMADTTTRIRKKIEEKGKEPDVVFHFECLGRAQGLIGERKSSEIVEIAQQNLTQKSPWLGWYTYGEIAPVKGKNEYHNWSGIILAIY